MKKEFGGRHPGRDVGRRIRVAANPAAQQTKVRDEPRETVFADVGKVGCGEDHSTPSDGSGVKQLKVTKHAKSLVQSNRFLENRTAKTKKQIAEIKKLAMKLGKLRNSLQITTEFCNLLRILGNTVFPGGFNSRNDSG